MLKELPDRVLNQIAAFDKKEYQGRVSEPSISHQWGCTKSGFRMNVTRYYRWFVANGNDLELHTVAVKVRKTDGWTFVKEVTMCSVDTDKLWVKDMGYKPIAGYVVDWSPEGIGVQREFDYEGKFESDTYKIGNNGWKVGGQILNPEVLARHDRFKYCAYDGHGSEVMDYLKTYAQHPKIETLSKIGFGHFATRPTFVRLIESDKQFCNFFREHMDEIKANWLGVETVTTAYRKKISFDKAQAVLECRRIFRREGGKLYGVDPAKADAYLVDRASVYEYCQYLTDCRTLGLDLTDTKNAFPKDFERKRTDVRNAVMAEVEKQNKEARKIRDKKLKAIAQKLSQIEYTGKNFAVRIPKTPKDFEVEGKGLRHCVGGDGYISRMAQGKIVIAFVRQTNAVDKPFVTVEYSVEDKEITQCYAERNSKPPADVCKMVYGSLTKRFQSITEKQIVSA